MRTRVPWAFAVPALLVYAVIVVYPNLAGVTSAFTDDDGLGGGSFVGLDNFARLFGDPQALGALWHTLALAAVVTIVQNALGLALALGLHANVKSRNWLRVAFFAPAVLAPIILAYLWQYLYTPDGTINDVLRAVGLGGLAQDWLGNPDLSLWAVAVAVIWQHAGISMVIFLAGLQAIPEELHDAAEVDGATRIQRFRRITLPLLAPATTIAVVLTIVTSMKLFDQVFAMTGGGPGYASETLSTIMYEQAFALNRYGYGTAIAMVLTMLVAAIGLVQLRVLRRYEEQLT